MNAYSWIQETVQKLWMIIIPKLVVLGKLKLQLKRRWLRFSVMRRSKGTTLSIWWCQSMRETARNWERSLEQHLRLHLKPMRRTARHSQSQLILWLWKRWGLSWQETTCLAVYGHWLLFLFSFLGKEIEEANVGVLTFTCQLRGFFSHHVDINYHEN